MDKDYRTPGWPDIVIEAGKITQVVRGGYVHQTFHDCTIRIRGTWLRSMKQEVARGRG